MPERRAVQPTDQLCPLDVDVPVGGFEWREAHWDSPDGASTGPCLVASGPLQRRRVLSGSRLLHDFAALAGDPHAEAIVGFADRYGWLAEAPMQLTVSEADGPIEGEPREVWHDACHDFVEIWTVWRGVESSQSAAGPGKMLPSVRWFLQSDAAQPGAIMRVKFPGRFHAVLLHRLRQWLHITRSTNALEPYRHYVARRCLERLGSQVMPAIDLRGGLGICLMPNSLLAAIYWELAILALSDSRSR